MAARAHADEGLERRLWDMADALRGSMDASEYKNVVLGLIFLKYVSDAFEARREELEAAIRDRESDLYFDDYERGVEVVLDDRDRFAEANVFWVPPEARWERIQDNAKQAGVGELIDDAMLAIEHDNDRLKGVLPVVYANPTLDKRRLGEVVDLISGIGFHDIDADRDVLGRVYEYFLLKFDMAYGRAAGEFYTPRDVVQMLVEMVEPYEGRVYDPCAGSGGMFVQSAGFVTAHGGSVDDIAVYGQESNPTTWKLAKMNLALKGIEADLGDQWSDTFANPKHPDLKADFALSNPPYNIDSWHRVEDDPRWKYGVPPARNSNYGWMQHILHHLAPGGGAGVVMANGTLTTEQSGEHHIRRKMLEDEVVDCIVTLPSQLFYTTQIPVCLWFFSRARSGQKGQRERTGEVLFINAKNIGEMVSRTNRELTDDDIARIADTYHAWRGTSDDTYEDELGFCRSVTLDEIWEHDGVLTPGRYVGMAEVEDDGEPFDEKMDRLVGELAEHFARGTELRNASAATSRRSAMTSDIGRAPLGDVAEIIMGQSPPGDTYNDNGVGVPLVNGPAQFGTRAPLATKWTTSPIKMSREGDVVFCVRGSTTGRMVRADGEYCLGRGVASIRGSMVRDSDFIYYGLTAKLAHLLQQATGSTFPNLSSRSLSRFTLPWPGEPTRHAVAEVLGALDDRIEWCAGAADRIESLLLMLSRGGDRAEPVSGIADYVNGGAYTKHASGTGRLVIRIAELSAGVGDSSKYAEIETPLERTAYPGDILFSWSATLDVYRWTADEAVVNQHIFKVLPKDAYPAWLVYAKLKEAMSSFQKLARDRATTMGHIKRAHLDSVTVQLPPDDHLAHVRDLGDALWEQHLRVSRERQHVAAVRDTLLPQLLSGELRIEDPSRVLGAVA